MKIELKNINVEDAKSFNYAGTNYIFVPLNIFYNNSKKTYYQSGIVVELNGKYFGTISIKHKEFLKLEDTADYDYVIQERIRYQNQASVFVD